MRNRTHTDIAEVNRRRSLGGCRDTRVLWVWHSITFFGRDQRTARQTKKLGCYRFRDYIETGEFTKMFFGGFVVGVSRLYFRREGTEKSLFIVNTNGCSKHPLLAVLPNPAKL